MCINSLAIEYDNKFLSVSEQSNGKQTGRYDEIQNYCKELPKKFPLNVTCKSYGTSPEGRTMYYFELYEKPKKYDFYQTIWIQAGIHAGEIDGKDAMLWLIHDWLFKKKWPNLLKNIRIIFIPMVNIDGHERFGPWNRPNQNGPEEKGWRTTAQNLNMNRDFVKMDAPEMQALNTLWNKVSPAISLDLHTTDGAEFQIEVGIMIYPGKYYGASDLHKVGSDYEAYLLDFMKQKGHSAIPFYPKYEKEDDPMSGFSRNVSPPRFSQSYWSIQNRIGVLVETHSWKQNLNRIKSNYSTILGSIEFLKKNLNEIEKALKKQDEQVLEKEYALEYDASDKFTMIEFPGYKYEIYDSKNLGTKIIKYFPDQKQIWKVPFYQDLEAKNKILVPKKGYWIPVQEAKWIKEKLKIHNVEVKEILETKSDELLVFRADDLKMSAQSFEGRQTLEVNGQWKREKVELLKGSLFVPINQSKSKLVMHLFEPSAPDSFLHWGFFNRYFETKEYMESYLVDGIADELFSKNPDVKNEFNTKLKDQKFSKDPEQRIKFFYEKHPSWDNRAFRYPIFKE